MEAADLITKHKSAVVNIAMVIVAVLIGLKIYGNSMQKLAIVKADVDIETQKNAMLAQIGQQESDLKVFQDALPRLEESRVMGEFNELATGAGVKIASLRPVQPEVKVDYIQYPFTLSIRAKSYHDIGRYVSMLESSGSHYVVSDIKIQGDPAAKDLSADLTVFGISYNTGR